MEEITYQTLSVATQIRLLARNWMRRALLAFASKHAAVTCQCALDLGADNTPTVPSVLADTWIMYHAFFTARTRALQQCVALGRIDEFALTMKSLKLELLQWENLVQVRRLSSCARAC